MGWIMFSFIRTVLNLFRFTWWRWQIEGLENLPRRDQGGMILASNHIDWLDVVILGTSVPYRYRPHWIAKVELLSSRVLTWFFLSMQVIPIKRGKRDLSAMYAAEDAVKRGAVLVIFPEGTRSRTGQLQEGRGGAARIAARSGAPMVPVALWGTEGGFKGAMRRKPIHVRFGKPFYLHSDSEVIPADRMHAMTEEMMVRIAELLPEEYRGVYRDRVAAAVTADEPHELPAPVHA